MKNHEITGKATLTSECNINGGSRLNVGCHLLVNTYLCKSPITIFGQKVKFIAGDKLTWDLQTYEIKLNDKIINDEKRKQKARTSNQPQAHIQSR